jgi:hypothetical protein
MKFTCIGFDVRKYPWEGFFSADMSEWERDDDLYEKLIADYGLVKNEYNLLTIQNNEKLFDVSRFFVKNDNSCDLVAIEFPLDIVKYLDSRRGNKMSFNRINLSDFICLGLDICDADLWSILNHPLIETFREENGLIPESRIFDALEAVQLSNVVESSHRPSFIAKIYSFKSAREKKGHEKKGNSPRFYKHAPRKVWQQ